MIRAGDSIENPVTGDRSSSSSATSPSTSPHRLRSALPPRPQQPDAALHVHRYPLDPL